MLDEPGQRDNDEYDSYTDTDTQYTTPGTLLLATSSARTMHTYTYY